MEHPKIISLHVNRSVYRVGSLADSAMFEDGLDKPFDPHPCSHWELFADSVHEAVYEEMSMAADPVISDS